jgi:L-lactate dehydrogenase complex protein LldG
MNRKKILANIGASKPPLSPLPEVPLFLTDGQNFVAAFVKMVEGGAGKILEAESLAALDSLIGRAFPDAGKIYCRVEGCSLGTMDPAEITNPAALQDVDIAILPAQLGVAENGAIWLDERDLGLRISAFIAQHLVVVVKKEAIVENMHVAYGQLKTGETGFGVFIAGPSKTADIEQALVIGAQAARSYTVVLV